MKAEKRVIEPLILRGSREKVMEILGVSAPTLWRWEKTGYLKTVRLGGKVRYRMSDVKHVLQDKK